jgi:hypothetical protein
MKQIRCPEETGDRVPAATAIWRKWQRAASTPREGKGGITRRGKLFGHDLKTGRESPKIEKNTSALRRVK